MASYTGDLKYVYEVGYGISLGIYDTQLADTNSGAFKFGCGVDSTAMTSSRRAIGVSVEFVATVSTAEATTANEKAADLAPAGIVFAVNEANNAVVAGGTVAAGSIAMPALSDVGTIQQSITASGSPSTAPTTSPQPASSSGYGMLLLVSVVGAICVVAIVVVVLLCYCCARAPAVYAPQVLVEEGLEDKPTIGVRMEPASRL